MKARRVRGLDPEGTFADNSRRIVRTRLDELCRLADAALDPTRRRDLHDARIAAKRLRYVLEITGVCLGPYALRAVKHARSLQDEIGAIHDCDVMIPLVEAHLAAIRSADADTLRARASEVPAISLDAARGVARAEVLAELELLLVTLQARRDAGFESFVARWRRLERSGFRRRLEEALA